MRIVFFIACLILYCSVDGQEFLIDPGHTSIQFSVERFAAVEVPGRFNSFTGSVFYDEAKGGLSKAVLSIDVNSIDTGHETRDGHLKGEVWLDAERFPNIEFEATSFQPSAFGFIAVGTLTVHGVSKEVKIPFQMNGPEVDPTKALAIGIKGSLTIDRQDFGIVFSKLLDNGKLFIGNKVEIQIHALFLKK